MKTLTLANETALPAYADDGSDGWRTFSGLRLAGVAVMIPIVSSAATNS